jgi:hypothetical protein
MSRPGTFNAGRNRQKRAARAAEVQLRQQAIRRFQTGDLTVNTAKVKRSRLMVDLLANRRLRQRQVRPS